jgi:predicted enzyme related to lactoylglutathione lyase
MSKHPIVHIEFSANDREAAAQFYNEIFGWEIQHMPEMNYSSFMCDDKLGGGFNPVTEQAPAGTVLVYIQVDDFEATLAEIETRGGKTIMPKTEIPTVGWFAVFADPTGNQVALYKGMQPS